MKYKLEQLISVDKLAILIEKFYQATGTGSFILDVSGKILAGCGWQPICMKFHRGNPETEKRCIESDTSIANSLKAGKKYNIYHCLNGLVDVAMPIYINEEHLGNLFIGQFLVNEPDRDFFIEQAEKSGFPQKEYLEALDQVPVLSEKDVKLKLEFLTELANIIGELGWQRLQSLEMQDELENRVKTRTRALRESQIATLNIMQDVEEERKKTEALNENLIKINKELEMFAYVASHDLQEPLRKVYSFTELLEKRYGYLFDERAKKYMNYITSGANRMQHLIRDLLRFSRVGTSERPFKRFDLNSVFDQLLQDLSLKIDEKEAKIKIDNLPAIIADRTQIIQLWQNLLGNALKFCGEDTPVIHIKAEEKENEWLFSIKDNGIGIQKEYADKIFVIFQRLHEREKYEGTGIGLALCKKIVERHNGRIWFDSEPGEGSTFYFTISRNLI